jgi:hypothetical protein
LPGLLSGAQGQRRRRRQFPRTRQVTEAGPALFSIGPTYILAFQAKHPCVGWFGYRCLRVALSVISLPIFISFYIFENPRHAYTQHAIHREQSCISLARIGNQVQLLG